MIDPARKAFLDHLHAWGREHGGMWNLNPEAAQALHVLALAINAQRALEIGGSNGYSTIWLADALERTGGHLISLEADPRKVAMATANLQQVGLLHRVQTVLGDARQTVLAQPGPFDLVLIDADKESYVHYLEAVLPKLRRGGLIMADNVRSHAGELRTFLERVRSDPRLDAVELPFGPGQLLACWLPA